MAKFTEKLIEVKNLSKHFNVGKGKVLKAVDNVTLISTRAKHSVL